MLAYKKTYYLLHPIELILECYRKIKYAYQRVYRGWDDRVVWSVDWWFCEIMPGILRKLKSSKVGIPIRDIDLPNYEDDPEEHERLLNEAKQNFDEALDKMIVGFELYTKYPKNGEDVRAFYEEQEKKIDVALTEFKKWFGALWD